MHFHTITSILKRVADIVEVDSVDVFPYDYVYFKALHPITEAPAHIHDFHTITSILKPQKPRVRIDGKIIFPYDYVYFKARVCCIGCVMVF